MLQINPGSAPMVVLAAAYGLEQQRMRILFANSKRKLQGKLVVLCSAYVRTNVCEQNAPSIFGTSIFQHLVCTAV